MLASLLSLDSGVVVSERPQSGTRGPVYLLPFGVSGRPVLCLAKSSSTHLMILLASALVLSSVSFILPPVSAEGPPLQDEDLTKALEAKFGA
ncbi:hypothetical protein BO99DRAFT_64117 [Aspergillus violaceofuscus CBS 115571]|uniref:Uncharacterized protein n=1 Tax=Aspergillus violaceofuscus (strain CBS 115571) TaxID=1450538 RepID=A0A2V5GRG7_ASPV1|nr:hypothetical protein BO99DRAFT_64117 [Aspergillus violaceofuscus CBS 115571]